MHTYNYTFLFQIVNCSIWTHLFRPFRKKIPIWWCFANRQYFTWQAKWKRDSNIDCI